MSAPLQTTETKKDELSASPFEVCRLREDQWELWDKLYLEAADATPYASSVYLRALSATLQRPVSAFLVKKGGDILAGLAVVERKQLGMRVVTAQPSTTYSALLYSSRAFGSSYPAKNTSEYIALSRCLLAAVKAEFSSVTLSFPPEIDDVRPWMWAGWSVQPSYTYRIDLSSELRANYSVQKHVRKCERNGLIASMEWNPAACWALVQETRRRQGVSIGLDEEQFHRITTKLHEEGTAWMVSVYDPDGVPLSARIELSIPGSNVACDWIAGSSPMGFSVGANSWNVMKVVEECRTRGYGLWDMCGASYENIARFKSEFGGTLAHGFSAQSPRPLLLSSFAFAWRQAGKVKQKLIAQKGR